MNKIRADVTIRKSKPGTFMRLKTTRPFTDGLTDMVDSFNLTPDDIVMVVVGRNQIGGDSDLIQWEDDNVHGKVIINRVTLSIFAVNVHTEEALVFVSHAPEVSCKISEE